MQLDTKKRFETLYLRIHQCRKCPNMCHEKALRDISRTNTKADVLIVSQALAEGTLRKSGINFFDEKLKLGGTGRNLEKFLNLFGRTVDFRKPNCIYNSEVAQCFPGKAANGKGDRKPTTEECLNCKAFLEEEIAIVKPRLILAMGKASFEFLEKHLLENGENGCTYKGIPVIRIQHASPANPRFYQMLKDKVLIDEIRTILHYTNSTAV
jgi:uracil-DNA glycosylase family 4